MAEQNLVNLIERGFKEVGEKIADLGQRRGERLDARMTVFESSPR